MAADSGFGLGHPLLRLCLLPDRKQKHTSSQRGDVERAGFSGVLDAAAYVRGDQCFYTGSGAMRANRYLLSIPGNCRLVLLDRVCRS